MALKISEFLKPKAIIMDIKSREKLEAIKELVDHMVAKKFVKNGEDFLQALAKRENLESTGIGNGIAIPHARTDSVKDVLLAFARSPEGVDFSSGKLGNRLHRSRFFDFFDQKVLDTGMSCVV